MQDYKLYCLKRAIKELRKKCPTPKHTKVFFVRRKDIRKVIYAEAYTQYNVCYTKIVLPSDRGYDLVLAYLLHEWAHALIGYKHGHGAMWGRAYSKVFKAYYGTK